jgi:outer membrane protein with beta-barrel domain
MALRRRRQPASLLMRIPAIAFGLLLLCGAPASGQGFTVGVKGGVNFSKVTFDGEDGSTSLDTRISGVIGGFVRFPLLSWLELQPEGLYSMKGGKQEEFGITSVVKLDYLEVPVLARIPLGGARYFAIAGPYFGVRLRAKASTEFSGGTEEMDIADQVERLDFGAVVGGGVELGSLVFDGRYSFGFKDVDADTSDSVKAKNRVISATVGFRF